jgi:hypothetical protein
MANRELVGQIALQACGTEEGLERSPDEVLSMREFDQSIRPNKCVAVGLSPCHTGALQLSSTRLTSRFERNETTSTALELFDQNS